MSPLTGATAGIFAAFNLLYSMGCSPSVEFQEVSWERRQPVEEAVEFYRDWFEGTAGLPPGELGGRISEYLAGVAEDGHVLRRTEGRTGTLTWRVSQR
jgi:hypothetical protein